MADEQNSLKRFLESVPGLEPAKNLKTVDWFDKKPCPFCGADGEALTVDGDLMCVVCNACGAEGPYRVDGQDSVQYAIELWNKRS